MVDINIIKKVKDYLEDILHPRLNITKDGVVMQKRKRDETIKLDQNDSLLLEYHNMLLNFKEFYQTIRKEVPQDFYYIEKKSKDMDEVYSNILNYNDTMQNRLKVTYQKQQKFQRFVLNSQQQYNKKHKQNPDIEPFENLKNNLYGFYGVDHGHQRYIWIIQRILMQFSIKGIDYATGYDRHILVQNLKTAIIMSHASPDFLHALNGCKEYWFSKKTQKYSIGKMFLRTDPIAVHKEIIIRSEMANHDRCSFCKFRTAEDSMFDPKQCNYIIPYTSWKFCGHCEYELFVNHQDVPTVRHVQLEVDEIQNTQPYIDSYLVNSNDDTKYYFYEDLIYHSRHKNKQSND